MSGEPAADQQSQVETRLLGWLEPKLLLRDILIHRIVAPTDRYYRIGLTCRYLGEPGGLDQYGDEAERMIEQIERNPLIAERIAALRRMGFTCRLGVYDEPFMRALTFYVVHDEKAEARLRDEAKTAAGVETREESEEFDFRLALYLNQRYGPDPEPWRERYPLVEWP